MATVIPLNKSKVLAMILLAAGFIGASALVWSISDSQERYNPLYLKCVSIVGVAFGSLCTIAGCFKLFDGKPGLTIDDDGIIDNASSVSAGRVPWGDILDLKIFQVGKQQSLVIIVANPQEYLDRSGLFKRMINTASLKLTGSPINISANTLKIGFDELRSILTEAIEQHRGSASH